MTPPSIAAVVLAAGTSSRMGGVNKQLATIGETPMAARAADAALGAGADPVVALDLTRDRLPVDGQGYRWHRLTPENEVA